MKGMTIVEQRVGLQLKLCISQRSSYFKCRKVKGSSLLLTLSTRFNKYGDVQ